MGVVAALAATALTACDAPYDVTIAVGTTGETAIYPLFRRTLTDYVNRCTPGQATPFKIGAPAGTTVSIDGTAPRSGSFSVPIVQQVGKKVTITLTTGGQVSTHYVRCLPADFPQWEAQRLGTPQSEYYLGTVGTSPFGANYPTIFDTNGVPVFWQKPSATLTMEPTFDGNLLSISTSETTFTESTLDGSIVRKLTLAGAEFHDVRKLTNGSYLIVANREQPCDLSSWGLSGTKTCLNQIIEEVTPDGLVVWQWDGLANIDPSETPQMWRDQLTANGEPARFDLLHFNSIDLVPDGVVISFRNLNAIYRIDRSTDQVVWKLGGTARPESLSVLGDAYSGAGGPNGQHDARLDGDVLSYFDNGTNGLGPLRRARSVAYRIDAAAKTATLTRDVSDPIAPTATCCGSSRILPGGNVVTGWGGGAYMTENKTNGDRVFLLKLGFIYRELPVAPGVFTPDQLRAGMDAQFATGRL